jgi:allantoin racemase
MRLWHQSRTELDRLPLYRQLLESHFSRISEKTTVVDLHGMESGTYQTEYPGQDAQFIYFTYLHSLQVLGNVQRAAHEGYDAVLLMNLPETVHAEAQSLVDIPVVSYGQASMYTAALLGRKFAILAMIPPFIPLYESLIRGYGMETRSYGAVPLGLDHRAIFAGFDDPAPVVEHLRGRTRELIAKGVDVIVSEAPVSAVLSKAGVSDVDGVPIVDGLGATVKFGELMVRLSQVSGMRPARRGFYGARPPEPRLAELTRYYQVERFSY